MSRTEGSTRARTIVRPDGADSGPGVLAQVSVSQVNTFDATQDGGCPTKWWLNKVMGREIPGTKAQAVGIEGHEQLEHYLLTGEDVLGPVARAGKHLLPPPRDPRVLVEHELRGTLAGVALLGYTDVLNTTGLHVD